jgi:hypothetical protein
MEMIPILFSVAALVGIGVVCAVMVAITLRGRRNNLKIAFVVLIAPSSFALFWLSGCYGLQQVKAATGHKHFWFFEAVCPLIGGYDLSYDAKFRLGSIAKHGTSSEDGPVQGVAALQMIPPAIAGQYADSFGLPKKDHYFLFDTQTGKLENLDSLGALENEVGGTVSLKTLDETFEQAR